MIDHNSIELEKQIRTENEEYFKIYDRLAEKLSKEEQINILNANKQFVPDDQNRVS